MSDLPGMVTAQISVWQCKRCGHQWPPRDKTREPKVCPKCKSPYWNTPRRHLLNVPGSNNQEGGQ